MTSSLLIRRGITTLVVFAAFLLAAEVLTRFLVFLAHPPLSHTAVFDKKYALAKSPLKDGKDHKGLVLFIGDSFASLGFYPELFEQRIAQAGLKVNALNLAVSGNNPRMSLALLKAAVESGKQPQMVLLNVSSRFFDNRQVGGANAMLNANEVALNHSYLGRCLLDKPQSMEHRLECDLSKVSYLVRYRSFLNQEFKQFPSRVMNPELTAEETDNLTDSQISYKGWTPYASIYGQAPPEETTAHAVQKLRRKGRPTDLNTRRQWSAGLIQPIYDYCRERHIPLALVWTPRYPQAATVSPKAIRPEDKEYFARTQALAREWKIGFFDFRDAVPNPNGFTDPVGHLNVIGAYDFTQQLAVQLAGPPYRAQLEAPHGSLITDSTPGRL